MEALGGRATLATMSHDDDASYKTLFAAPEVVRDLILGFIPDDWLHSLDYRTLERVSGSYVTDDLRDRADDIVGFGCGLPVRDRLYAVPGFI